MNEDQEKHTKLLEDRVQALRDLLHQSGNSRLLSVALTDLEKFELIAHKALMEARG